MRKLSSYIISSYNVTTKGMDRLLREEQNQLVTRNNPDLSQQNHIKLINGSWKEFFNTAVDLAPQVASSLTILIKTFIHQYYTIMAIERTQKTQEPRKYIIILNSTDYRMTIEKLGKLFDCL